MNNPQNRFVMNKKYLICTPSYSDDNGGAVALHNLCHQLNANNLDAYLFPIVENLQLNRLNFTEILPKFLKKQIREPFRRLKVNKELKTPVIYKLPAGVLTGEYIVVYPEITFGNPLRAKNVVRWLLHNPGHDTSTGRSTKEYFYGKNELYFRYGTFYKEFQNPGSTTSPHILRVERSLLHWYNQENTATQRQGTAYCMRKGAAKPIVHDTTNSILIDGKKHREIAEIFKKVKTFICYDTHTLYSELAALCGCDSIVIPDDNLTIDEWRPELDDRYGVSYGFDNLEWARNTQQLLLEKHLCTVQKSTESVLKFSEITQEFFNE